MRFGTGTWHFSDIRVVDALYHISEVGYTIVEVWMEHLRLTGESIDSVKNAAAALGLELTLHATTYDLNLTSINAGAREEAKRQAIQSIVGGAQMGAKIIVVHPGRVSTEKESAANCMSRLYEVLRTLDDIAADENVTLALEVMQNRPDELVALPETVNALMRESWRSLQLTFDIAHAHTVTDPSKYLEQIDRTRIAHVHVNDLDSANRQMPLGQGNLAIRESIDSLSAFYEGAVIVEGYNTGNAIEVIQENYLFLRANGWV